jgi:hypothetical protein
VGALRHDTTDDVQHGIEAVLPARIFWWLLLGGIHVPS